MFAGQVLVLLAIAFPVLLTVGIVSAALRRQYRRRRAELARWAGRPRLEAHHRPVRRTGPPGMVAASRSWSCGGAADSARSAPRLPGGGPVRVDIGRRNGVGRDFSGYRNLDRDARDGFEHRFLIKPCSANLPSAVTDVIATSRIPFWWVTGDHVVASDDSGWREAASLNPLLNAVTAVAAAMDAAEQIARPTAQSVEQHPILRRATMSLACWGRRHQWLR